MNYLVDQLREVFGHPTPRQPLPPPDPSTRVPDIYEGPTVAWWEGDDQLDVILDSLGNHARNKMLEELEDGAQTGRTFKMSSRKGKAAKQTTFRDHPYYIKWLKRQQKKHPHVTWYIRWRRDRKALKHG
jgi:hypothetical protein